MSSQASITALIDLVKQGNADAVAALWDEFFPRLVGIARDQLHGMRGKKDEEDIALSAMDSFVHAARNGRFPDLADRNGLWRLLSRMTRRKAIDYIQHVQAQKHGGGHVRSGSAVRDDLLADDPTPQTAAILSDECRRLLGLLDGRQYSIAMDKLHGYPHKEIAQRQAISMRTVERELHLIRKKWYRELDR